MSSMEIFIQTLIPEFYGKLGRGRRRKLVSDNLAEEIAEEVLGSVCEDSSLYDEILMMIEKKSTECCGRYRLCELVGEHISRIVEEKLDDVDARIVRD